ncbi:hypothetical protein F5Y01DRAFT_319049 [Xylaria sp. FL0043]|nr:hypothetical protein F5Y01DRAFT_319049 [Xylaria sp. FL0043]
MVEEQPSALGPTESDFIDVIWPGCHEDERQRYFYCGKRPHIIKVLGGIFKVEMLAQETNQYRNLSVGYCIPGSQQGSEPCNFEGRLYNFDNLTPKERHYRLRSLKRLGARVVLNTTWEGYEFVIFRSGSLEEMIHEEDTKLQPSTRSYSDLQVGAPDTPLNAIWGVWWEWDGLYLAEIRGYILS